MKENEKEKNSFRNTINYVKTIKNGINEENKQKKICMSKNTSLSSKQLLQNHIPKIKPIGAKFEPSPINLNLFGKEQINIDEKNFAIEPNENPKEQLLIVKVKSVNNKKEKHINSSDEEYDNTNYNKINYSSGNESKDNEDKSGALNINKGGGEEEVSNVNKSIHYCINKIRRKMDKIKNKIKYKKFNEDSDAFKFTCTQYFDENYRLRLAQKFINKIKLKKLNEYEKFKNKTISFSSINSNRPPILGFLQMNEISLNTTLSSSNLSSI